MVDNTDCGHSEWPLGTSTLPSCSTAKSAWENLFPSTLHAEVLAVHPLKYLRDLYPYAAWLSHEQRSSSPITSQTSSPAAHVPADMGELRHQPDGRPCFLEIYGPSQMESGSLERARTAKMSLSKKRPKWGWPKMQSPVLSYR